MAHHAHGNIPLCQIVHLDAPSPQKTMQLSEFWKYSKYTRQIVKYESRFHFFCNFENSKIFIKMETENSECHLLGSPDTLTSDLFSPTPTALVTLCLPGSYPAVQYSAPRQLPAPRPFQMASQAPCCGLISSSHADMQAGSSLSWDVVSPITLPSYSSDSGDQPFLSPGPPWPAPLPCSWDLTCSKSYFSQVPGI